MAVLGQIRRREGEGTEMQNEELKPEMKVRVDHDGSSKLAKVIGPATLKKGKLIEITGWVVAIEPSNLHVTLTADKIHRKS
jgi:hypothetical protein